jgi:hypothetical protein
MVVYSVFLGAPCTAHPRGNARFSAALLASAAGWLLCLRCAMRQLTLYPFSGSPFKSLLAAFAEYPDGGDFRG